MSRRLCTTAAARPGTRGAVALLALGFIVAASATFASTSRALPATGGLTAVPAAETPVRTRYRAWVDDPQATITPAYNTAVAPRAQLDTRFERDVRCNEFLELEATVREADGTVLAGVPVMFEWRFDDRVYRMHDQTDWRGVAAVRRWVGASTRGRLSVVVVSANTERWSAQRYAWFVAR